MAWIMARCSRKSRSNPRYRENARRHQSDIAQIDGFRRAATIAEQALTRREAVLRS